MMGGGGGLVEGRAGDKKQKGVRWDVGKASCMKGFYDTGSPKQSKAKHFTLVFNLHKHV